MITMGCVWQDNFNSLIEFSHKVFSIWIEFSRVEM